MQQKLKNEAIELDYIQRKLDEKDSLIRNLQLAKYNLEDEVNYLKGGIREKDLLFEQREKKLVMIEKDKEEYKSEAFQSEEECKSLSMKNNELRQTNREMVRKNTVSINNAKVPSASLLFLFLLKSFSKTSVVRNNFNSTLV